MLNNVLKGTKIIESLENYSIVDTPSEKEVLEENLIEEETEEYSSSNQFILEDRFWEQIMANESEYRNKKITLRRFAICDWVARVPGLYWTDSSRKLRQRAGKHIVKKSKDFVEYRPIGKSMKVVGGVGTIHLPPDDDGKRLISVSSSGNASLGIPILIFPDVIDYYNLKEGDVVDIIGARWQPYNRSWSKNFASTKDIPRNYLVVNDPSQIEVLRRGVPIVYHPFSIMEYQHNDALLYDFVYLSIDNKVNNRRSELDSFFTNYSKEKGRKGKYIINPDMVNPIFESTYNFPSEMKDASELAQIGLLYEKVRETMFDGAILDKIIKILPTYYSNSNSIRRLAKNIGISDSIFKEDKGALMSGQLINYCVENNKIENLIDRICNEYSEILNKI
ncbi:hypothetical protein [Aureispira anguillae]|uniref:Uncharacterized protein n=1 Tax=Aureispira anguillae TaxID=2864201 RepID=A0A915YG32_9BACT|nr:hypothetical protein [Aureispira anguillae]BDS12397.1 hypothetical protein AsAng_0031180 [Aureispira anguillae]